MTVDKYLVKHFIPVFFVALSLFVVLVLLIDLFGNLVNYLNYEASFREIIKVSYYYIPKSISYALPISLLFAVAYTIGDLCARNELTSIISSGISYWRFGISLMLIGVLVSFVSFFFEDNIVVQTLKTKNDLAKEIKQQPQTTSSSNVVIKTYEGKRIYAIDYYDYQNQTLNGVLVIELDDNKNFVSQIRANIGVWNDTYWSFSNAVIYQWENNVIRIRNLPQTDKYDDHPELFRRSAVDPAELPARDAKFLVDDLRTVGLPHIEALSEYYHRFSFPATSFIVIILSFSMGGRFRKNILLMSLLSSLAVSVVFYVMDMISMMMARLGYIPPIVGAWLPVVFFIIVGAVLMRYSKT